MLLLFSATAGFHRSVMKLCGCGRAVVELCHGYLVCYARLQLLARTTILLLDISKKMYTEKRIDEV